MLKSDAVKNALVSRFKLMEVYKTKYRSDASMRLERNSSIGAGKKDGVITISVEDKDPARAAALVDAYMDELGKLAVRVSVNGATKNRTFLEERLAIAKSDLAKAEESLKQFQSQNKALDVPAQSKIVIESIAKLKAELTSEEVKIATLRMKYTDSSPHVKMAIAAEDDLKAQIAKMEGYGGGSSIPSVGTIPALGGKYIRLMREFKIQETLVELLTKQYEMAQLSASKDIVPFQIINKAEMPDKKSKPHRLLIVQLITLNAVILTVLTIIIIDRINLNWHGTK